MLFDHFRQKERRRVRVDETTATYRKEWCLWGQAVSYLGGEHLRLAPFGMGNFFGVLF